MSDRDYRYDAFISYSHRSDTAVAVAVQNALHQLARPLLRRRALSAFRDKTSLSASPALWPTIEAALEQSRHFLLVASPASRESPWVHKEVAWWMAKWSGRNFLIVLTDGEAIWDQQRDTFHPSTTALSQACAEHFRTEPLYVDLRWARDASDLSLRNSRFREAILPLAAQLHGVEPQDLDGEDLRQFRRTRRFWRGAIAGLAMLTLTSVIAAVIAIRNRNEALDQAQLALSQKLAVDASHQPGEDRDRALLLAREAYLLRPTSEARLSLLAALLGGRHVSFARQGRNTTNLSNPSCVPVETFDAAADVPPSRLEQIIRSTPKLSALFDSSERIRCIAEGPNGLLAVAANTSSATAFRFPAKLVIWNRNTDNPLWRPITSHRERITALAFAPDGRWLVSADGRGSMLLWQLGAAEPDGETLEGHKAEVDYITFEDSGSTFVSASVDGDVIRWRTSSLQPIATTLGDRRATSGRGTDFGFARVGYVRGGRTLVATIAPDRLVAWDVTRAASTGVDLTVIAGPHRGLATDPHGTRVAIATPQEVRLVDVETRRADQVQPDIGQPYSVAFAPGGTSIAIGTRSGTVGIWTLPGDSAPRRIWSAQPGKSQIYDVAFDASGRRLLATAGNSVAVWSIDTGIPDGSPTLLNTGGRVVRATLSADAELLAAATWDGRISIWNMKTRETVGRPLLEHRGSTVQGLEFSPDRTLLASSDANGLTIIWDVSQQQSIARLSAGGPTTSGLAFSPDGRQLAAGSENRVITLWDLEVDTWLRLACTIAQRNLTPAEWNRYLLNRSYQPSCRF